MARPKPSIPQRPVPGAHLRPEPLTLPGAIMQLAVVLRDELHHVANALQSLGSGSTGVTTEQFNQGIQTLMKEIQAFAARQSAFNDRLDTAVAGVAADVAALAAKIEELQNTPGVITPEDQALLDDIEARSDAIATKLEALDAMTPPAVEPPVEPLP